jgi:hypothetical protein
VRPNVLLVVFDTARADAFEPYGAPSGASTTVGQLASSGLAHQATYSTACWTVPAHASLFSGRLPRSAGMGHTGEQGITGFRSTLQGIEKQLLPSVLGDAGYATYGVSANAWVSPEHGFDTGFERFVRLTGTRYVGLVPGGMRNQARWALEALRARSDDGAEAIAALLDEWLAGRDGRPFFMFVNLVECHSPFLPPKPWNDLGPIDRLRAGREAQRHLTFSELWKANVGGFDVPDGAIDRMRRSYAASIRQLDDWLARVLDLLDRHGLLADTEVVVTSDHGENLGDGDRLGHAFSLDDRLIRLPFVASGPLDLAAPELLSIADVPKLLATSLELPRHPWPEGPTGDPAVAQFDAPGIPGDARIEEALRLWGLDEEASAEARRRLCTSFTCATDGSLKLIRAGASEAVVDLSADPLEAAPVAVDGTVDERFGARLRALRSALDRAEAEERVAPPPAAAPGAAAMDPDLEEQMKLLGYM